MTDGRPRQWHADLNTLAEIRGFVQESALAFGATEQEISDVLLAVNEAVTNSLLHGYGGAGLVRIEVRRKDAQLWVSVIDYAPTFDPTTHPPPDLGRPLDQRGDGGMGIHMMRMLTDELVHCPSESGGNELILKKNLARDA